MVNMGLTIIGNGVIRDQVRYDGLPMAAYHAIEAVITNPESYGTGTDEVRVVGFAANAEGHWVDMTKVVSECSMHTFLSAMDACWEKLRGAQGQAKK